MADVWGLYPWFEEHGASLVHPDDLDAFRELMPYGKVFMCLARNEFLTLRYRDRSYRVRASLFRPVGAPTYTFGQRVVIAKIGSEAVVDEIQWHHQRCEPMFFLIQSGKRLKKRFWAEDLLPAE